MENLRVLRDGERAYRNMEAVCAILNALCETDTVYEVGNTYFDFGAGIRWTTIINSRGTQILYPVHWERIVTAETARELAEIVDFIRERKYFSE